MYQHWIDLIWSTNICHWHFGNDTREIITNRRHSFYRIDIFVLLDLIGAGDMSFMKLESSTGKDGSKSNSSWIIQQIVKNLDNRRLVWSAGGNWEKFEALNKKCIWEDDLQGVLIIQHLSLISHPEMYLVAKVHLSVLHWLNPHYSSGCCKDPLWHWGWPHSFQEERGANPSSHLCSFPQGKLIKDQSLE